MEIETKDVSPALRLAEIEKSVPIKEISYKWVPWIIGLAIAGAVSAFLIHNRKKKKRESRP